MDNPRRRRFVAWYAKNYKDSHEGRAKFMADTAKTGQPALTKGRVSHFFDEKQPFGELAAKNLAQRLGLPPDFFERDDEAAAAPRHVADIDSLLQSERYQHLGERERGILRDVFEKYAQRAPASDASKGDASLAENPKVVAVIANVDAKGSRLAKTKNQKPRVGGGSKRGSQR